MSTNPMRTARERDALFTALSIIVRNARIIPDPDTSGYTECYRVPVEDIDAARDLLRELSP